MSMKDVEQCDVVEVHEDTVKRVLASMPEEDELYDLAELFKVFGDSTRIRILTALDAEPMCVCDLAESLGMTQSAVSHQLRILKQAKLARAERDGRQVRYSLDDDHVRTIIAVGLEHQREGE